MNDLEQWKLFEKTGNICDYLNYTACTSENYFSGEAEQQSNKKTQKESGVNDRTTNCNWNGFVHHAYWRV